MEVKMDLGRAITRFVIGPLFVGHGTQKLFGWFEGHGMEGTAGFLESLGLRPGKRHATAAGVAETAGGALLATGLLTPIAGALLTGTMATAVKTVHIDKGPWVAEGGWEYNAVLAAALLTITEAGPGKASLDHKLGIRLSGPVWALAEVAAGLGGAAALLEVAHGLGQAAADDGRVQRRQRADRQGPAPRALPGRHHEEADERGEDAPPVLAEGVFEDR
jgi:putative oxidoreductase